MHFYVIPYLFDIMTYFPYLFDIMTYFPYFMTYFLWSTLWYILTSLRTFHIFRLCHDILKDNAKIRANNVRFLPCLRSKCVHPYWWRYCEIRHSLNACKSIIPWRSWPLWQMIKCYSHTYMHTDNIIDDTL